MKFDRTVLRRTRATGIIAILVSLAALTALPAAAATAHKTKHLSLNTVTVGVAETNASASSYFAAQRLGYFKKQGITVNFVNDLNGFSQIVATLISNAYNFIFVGATSMPLAISQGVPIRGVMSTDYETNDELAITTAAASAHGIPATGGPKAQIQALKGSHILIGYSTATSSGYIDLLAALKSNGITFGTSGTSTDVNLTALGSPTVLAAALNSGKVDAIVNNPPITVQPNSIAIQIGLLQPLKSMPTTVLLTTTSFIQSHPDTVQAFITAAVQGWDYTNKHPQFSVKVMTPIFVNAGTTSPEVIQYLVAEDTGHRGKTPAITKAGYNAVEQVVALGSPTPATVPFSQFAVNKFVNTAITKLKLPIPKG